MDRYPRAQNRRRSRGEIGNLGVFLRNQFDTWRADRIPRRNLQVSF
jgi:hypothetical protein